MLGYGKEDGEGTGASGMATGEAALPEGANCPAPFRPVKPALNRTVLSQTPAQAPSGIKGK